MIMPSARTARQRPDTFQAKTSLPNSFVIPLRSNSPRSTEFQTDLMSHQSDLIATDINAYLKQHESKQLLRFITCGSVDEGKSTLIGRRR